MSTWYYALSICHGYAKDRKVGCPTRIWIVVQVVIYRTQLVSPVGMSWVGRVRCYYQYKCSEPYKSSRIPFRSRRRLEIAAFHGIRSHPDEIVNVDRCFTLFVMTIERSQST